MRFLLQSNLWSRLKVLAHSCVVCCRQTCEPSLRCTFTQWCAFCCSQTGEPVYGARALVCFLLQSDLRSQFKVFDTHVLLLQSNMWSQFKVLVHSCAVCCSQICEASLRCSFTQKCAFNCSQTCETNLLCFCTHVLLLQSDMRTLLKVLVHSCAFCAVDPVNLVLAQHTCCLHAFHGHYPQTFTVDPSLQLQTSEHNFHTTERDSNSA